MAPKKKAVAEVVEVVKKTRVPRSASVSAAKKAVASTEPSLDKTRRTKKAVPEEPLPVEETKPRVGRKKKEPVVSSPVKESPKKRGRPAKTTSPTKKAVEKTKKTRKQDVEDPVPEPSPPKEKTRGRKKKEPKPVVEDPDSDVPVKETPKKKGRPAKKPETKASPPPKKAKAKVSPAKKADKLKKEAEGTAVTKAKTKSKKSQDVVEEEEEEQMAEPSPPKETKSRGRKKKTVVSSPVIASPEKEIPKKRGRPAKKDTKKQEEDVPSEVADEKPGDEVVQEEPNPPVEVKTKRGRREPSARPPPEKKAKAPRGGPKKEKKASGPEQQAEVDAETGSANETFTVTKERPESDVEPIDDATSKEPVDASSHPPAAPVSSAPVQSVDKPQSVALKRKAVVDEKPDDDKAEPDNKKARPEVQVPIRSIPTKKGYVYSCGTDGTGELGLRKTAIMKRRPTRIKDIADQVVSVYAGSQHSIVVTEDGKVFSFGNNDEGALGRQVAAPENGDHEDPNETEIIEQEMPEAIPGEVPIPGRVVQTSAGDSHTAVLTSNGQVFIWGCFRDQTGRVGLLAKSGSHDPSPILTPVQLSLQETVAEIASGDNHLVLLTDKGALYSFGVGEQGQLGRIAENESKIVEKTFDNISTFLTPARVPGDILFDKVWASNSSSFARSSDGDLYGWGLNNYNQLGLGPKDKSKATLNGETKTMESFPRKIPSFTANKVIQVAGGQHHTLFLDELGNVYSCGRHHYGRLGHGDEEELSTPKLIQTLVTLKEKVVSIACGPVQSYAVTESGSIYSWGTSEPMLGHSDPNVEDPDNVSLPKRITSRLLDKASWSAVSVGSQHSLFVGIPPEQPVNGQSVDLDNSMLH